MPDRKDALCAAAELILSVEKHALATGAIDTVATVGTCDVLPRRRQQRPQPRRPAARYPRHRPHPPRSRHAGHPPRLRRRCASAARSPSPKSSSTPTLPRNPPRTSSSFSKQICTEQGIAYKKMVSRAYHDSLFMARSLPSP